MMNQEGDSNGGRNAKSAYLACPGKIAWVTRQAISWHCASTYERIERPCGTIVAVGPPPRAVDIRGFWG
jgi:hypothetical protein